MSDAPPTLTHPLLEPVDTDVWTAAAIVNPGIVLIDWRRELHLLLARSMAGQGRTTTLHAVRLIRIPVDGRLTFIRWMSFLLPMHFPDEFLFEAVVLVRKSNNAYLAMVVPDGPRLSLSNEAPFPLKPLTIDQYERLASEPGRALLADALDIFATDLARLAPALIARLRGADSGPTPWPA